MEELLSLAGLIPEIIEDVPKFVGLIGFVGDTVTELESTTQTGEQKMDAVLNKLEVYLNANFPTIAKPFAEIATAVESVVQAAFDAFQAFKSAAPAPAA